MSLILFAVPFGILHDYPLANVSDTWSKWYEANYSDPTTTSDVTPNRGECIMMGSRKGEAAATLSVAAFGRRVVIKNAAGVQENGVYWYRESGSAVGFAPDNMVDLQPADTADPSAPERLSWHLDLNLGGYRSGATLDLNNDNEWQKVVMYGPCAVCPGGFYLGPHDCLPCENGYDSYPGATSCLMKHVEAVTAYLLAPQIAASVENGHGLAITAHAQAALPEVYGGISLYYAFDLSTSTTALSHDSNCSSLWVQETNTSFSLTFTLPDVGVCGFSMTIGNSSATLTAYVGMFIVSDSGLPSAPVITPLTVHIPLSFAASVGGEWGFERKAIAGVSIAVGAIPLALVVYETKEFVSVEDGLLHYTEGDAIFLNMVASGERANSFMEFVFLWLSASEEPEDAAAIRHNLTDKVLPPDRLERGSIQLSFLAVPCASPCYLHCLVRLTDDDPGTGVGRRLMRLLSATDSAAFTDKDYAWQVRRISISEADSVGEDVQVEKQEEEEVALLFDPLALVLWAIPVSFSPIPISLLCYCWKPLRCCRTPGEGTHETNEGRQERERAMPRQTLLKKAGGLWRDHYIYCLVEVVDMITDLVAFITAALAGELEHSNDKYDLLFWVLLSVIVLSFVLPFVEAAILLWFDPLLFGYVKMSTVVVFLHLYFEDNYQMMIYSATAASAYVNDGQFAGAALGIITSFLFLLIKAHEWIEHK